MAESSQPSDAADPGAPNRKDALDPDLVKLGRPASRIGVITAAGVLLLCVVFTWRLNGDRQFAGNDAAVTATVDEIVAGKHASDAYVQVTTELVMAHAIRAARNKSGIGLRVVPARGSGDRLWLVLSGDGWAPASTGPYQGRLEKLSELPFYDAVTQYAAAHPRPVFAKADAVRSAFTAGTVTSITNDTFMVSDTDKVAFDIVDPNAALIVAVFNERFPDAAAWKGALRAAGIPDGAPVALPPGASATEQIRVEVQLPGAVADVTKKLEVATLWAARVEPITRHTETTWGALKAAPMPADIDLVGLYVAKGIPDGAHALITGDRPEQYWYVLPITVALGVLGLIFIWVLVRVIKRDFIEPRVVES